MKSQYFVNLEQEDLFLSLTTFFCSPSSQHPDGELFLSNQNIINDHSRHFQIAFKMFDLNGDGNVDADEFDKVTDLMKQNSSTG